LYRFFRRSPAVLIATILCLLFFSATSAKADIHYSVSLDHPELHLFHVTMEVPGVKDQLTLQMAAWNALYEIRDFSSHVQEVVAFADGRPVEIKKLDKLTWQVQGSGTITVSYSTFWDDVGPFGAQLNSEHAFINPALILLYVPHRRVEQSTLLLLDVPPSWKVAAASLRPVEEMDGARRIIFQASSYDALADAPIEASHFDEFTIHDLAPPVHVVIHGDGWRKRDVESALRKICSYELKMMDGAPYDKYTFIFHVGKASAGGGGGMEHANSTAIFAASDAFLNNVSAHEFFHLWNVERIRPASLEPVDYTKEMYTRALWFAEGVTNTYGSYALVRTGLWNKQEFYQDLSRQISSLEVRPAEQWQSAEQSSLDAWLEKYALYNQPARSVSYYEKGQVLGVLLDILIRDRTDNQKSLDDVMRAMNTEFARGGKFYRDSLDIRLTAEKVIGSSLEDFFNKYIGGADPLPYVSVLSLTGLELHSYENSRTVLGFIVEHETNGAVTVRGIDAGSDAARAGLLPGDEILRWNNADPPRSPERWVSSQKPGDELRLRVKRDDKEEDILLRIGEVREKFYQVAESAHVSDRAKRIREGLLRGTTEPVTAKNH
jgi:predicted metalloprotease with PDZ domain